MILVLKRNWTIIIIFLIYNRRLKTNKYANKYWKSSQYCQLKSYYNCHLHINKSLQVHYDNTVSSAKGSMNEVEIYYV